LKETNAYKEGQITISYIYITLVIHEYNHHTCYHHICYLTSKPILWSSEGRDNVVWTF